MNMAVPARKVPKKFQVAFSFAGEQRVLVRAIAEAVEGEIGSPNVFFDEWFEYYLAGDDADLKLMEIYGEKCSLAVVCVSDRYGGKPWTVAEHRAIRARQMKGQMSSGEGDRLGILPIRVGDGDVKGILFNAIVPDVRSRSPVDIARLIVDRLRIIDPVLDTGMPALPEWLEEPPPLRWPMANHTSVRAAFQHLLTRSAQWRVLSVRGPSEAGKSHITQQMLANVLEVPAVACGRFDFKGTTNMDNELKAFVQYLRVPMPPANPRLSERLSHILDSIKQSPQPTLLVFDTYEAVGNDAEEWVEKQLLPSLIRANWLRVVIAGQRVPRSIGAIWEAAAAPVIQVASPPAADWFDYATRNGRPGVTMQFVETVCSLATGKAALLAQLFGPET